MEITPSVEIFSSAFGFDRRQNEVRVMRVLWLVIILAAIAAAAGWFLKNAGGFSAREQPSAVETWIAGRARAMAMPSNAKTRVNPVANSPEVLAEARAHWADHCAACHANNGSGDVEMGKHMYPPAPDMRQPGTQQLTDGELFFIIQNGIRLTGMPAWGGGSAHDERDSWKLVRFIRHLPRLTADEVHEMEQLNPKSPEDLKEEQQERDFLNGNGDTPNEHAEHQHHH
jgi:mono/diheme cytochrome c family protein